MTEKLKAVVQTLSLVSVTSKTPTLFTELVTAEFVAEQSKDLLCRKPGSPVGTFGFHYLQVFYGFIVCVALSMERYKKLLNNRLRRARYRCNTTCD